MFFISMGDWPCVTGSVIVHFNSHFHVKNLMQVRSTNFFEDMQAVYWYVGFEVLTAVVMKSSISWDITLCGILKVNRYFRRTCRLYLQGQRISQARN
jgi:hypothetical protein